MLLTDASDYPRFYGYYHNRYASYVVTAPDKTPWYIWGYDEHHASISPSSCYTAEIVLQNTPRHIHRFANVPAKEQARLLQAIADWERLDR